MLRGSSNTSAGNEVRITSQGAVPCGGSVEQGSKLESTINETTFVLRQAPILGRIVDFCDNTTKALGCLLLLNKATSKAAKEVYFRSNEARRVYTFEDLLNKDSELHSKVLTRKLIPDIDITVTPEEFARDDVREALLNLHKNEECKFKPVKFAIEIKDLAELRKLRVTQLPFMKEHGDLVRKVRVKDKQSSQSLATIQQEAQLFDSQPTANGLLQSKAFPVEVSWVIRTLGEFLNTDLTQLGNLEITTLHIKVRPGADLKLHRQQSEAFALQLGKLPYLKALMAPGLTIWTKAHIKVPASVTSLETGYISCSFKLPFNTQLESLRIDNQTYGTKEIQAAKEDRLTIRKIVFEGSSAWVMLKHFVLNRFS